MLNDEQWRDIPGWEGWYQVSNMGQVRSLQRQRTDKAGKLRRYPEKILVPVIRKSGAAVYKLHRDGKGVKVHLDRLMFQVWGVERNPGRSNQWVLKKKAAA